MPRPEAIVELTAGMDCCPSLLSGVLATGEAPRLTLGLTALGDPVRIRLLPCSQLRPIASCAYAT